MSNAKPPSKTKQRARKTGPRGSREGLPVNLRVAIDPGSKSAGRAVYLDGKYLWSDTQKLPRPSRKHGVVYIEVPQNGTHRSRGGVMFAAGRLYERWFSITDQHPMIRFVTPNEWREKVYDRLPKDGEAKEMAVNTVTGVMGIEVGSHDEAEAILMLEAMKNDTVTTKYAPGRRRTRRRWRKGK